MERRADYRELVDELKFTVEKQIKETVNGKIDKLTESVESIKLHLKKQDDMLEQLTPVRDGIVWFGTTNRFLKVVAAVLITLTTIFGAVKFLIPMGTVTFTKSVLNKTDIKDVVSEELDSREFEIVK